MKGYFIACSTAQMSIVHSIAQDVGVSDDTAKRRLKTLEQTGIIYYLPSYSDNLLKRAVNQL
jgi:predicted AAA+ superfamily ATPase